MKRWLIVSVFIAVAVIIINSSSQDSYAQANSNNTQFSNTVQPTYIIQMTTGAGTNYKFQHYYPLNAAVPIGTTVGWINLDPEQLHTITSGEPNSIGAGKIFNSGLIPYQGMVQYTMDEPGRFVYHCQIHPWMVGNVYVGEGFENKNNFRIALGNSFLDQKMGNEWFFNTTKIDRTLVDIQPLTLLTNNTADATYMLKIKRYNDEIFSKTFFSNNNDFQFEIVNVRGVEKIRSYGPDLDTANKGAYHILGDFQSGDYVFEIKMTAVGTKLVEGNVGDTFKIRIVR